MKKKEKKEKEGKKEGDKDAAILIILNNRSLSLLYVSFHDLFEREILSSKLVSCQVYTIVY